MEKTLHFSLGENFANLMGQIAQEHLLYDYDPEKALNIFEEGMGMPRDFALKSLSGENFVLRVEDNDSINFCDREESDTYPKLNGAEVAKRWADEILHESEELMLNIAKIYRTAGNSVNYEFSFQELINLFYNHDKSQGKSDFYEKLIEQIEDFEQNDSYEGNAVRKIKFMKFFNEWKSLVKKKMDVITFIKENNLSNDIESVKHSWRLIANQIVEVVEFFEREYYENLSRESEQDRLMATADKLCTLGDFKDLYKEHSDYVWECSTLDNADALWISPDGKAWGSCGAIRDMLHLEIADWLVEKEIINYEKDNNRLLSVDAYLEEEGWCKVHGNHVLFDPYAKSHDYEKASNFLTDAQVKFIADWFKNHNSFMQVGYKHTGITYIQWKNMDDIMRNKLFQY